METFKVIIVEDEKLAREIIKSYLSTYPEFELISECSNGFDAVKKINESKPDIVFLDVQMPKINGFEMLELIENPPVVIFTTAFDQYAVKAFEVNAADYLLKPFSSDRFAEALTKAKNKLNNVEQSPSIKQVQSSAITPLDKILIKDGSKITIITTDEINYIEAQDDYVMIHADNGKYLKQKTMKYYEDNLDSNSFLRIHRSYIVNLHSVSGVEPYEKESYRAILKNGVKIPMSKSGYDKLKEILEK